MTKLYAIGWQAGHGEVLGKLKNFREVISDECEQFVSNLQFANNIRSRKDTLLERFNESIETLQNTRTNGNNTDTPFFREIDPNLTFEYERVSLINEQLNQDLPKLTDFKNIRFYLVSIQKDEVEYRYYLKALRTATLKSRFIATITSGRVSITDLENEGKSLPYIISYAEKIENDVMTQYIFNVQDYEVIFGLNESKMKMAKDNYYKFLSIGNSEPEYKISREYLLEVSDEESDKIQNKLRSSRKLVNMLSKYNNEANNYEWEHIKEANNLSGMFAQTPFEIDEENKKIILTEDSLEAFVSVIMNAKKLGIAKNEYEDATADRRRNS